MTSPLPPESFFHLSHRGFVLFCLSCAEKAHEVMDSGRFAVDWRGSRSSAYQVGLEAVDGWTEIRTPTPEETDLAGQAASDAYAAAACAVFSAIDAGDDTNGARAVQAAALGMVVPLAMSRVPGAAGAPLWSPEYREDNMLREGHRLPWTRRPPDAPFHAAADAVEALRRAMPGPDWETVLTSLRARLKLLRSLSDPIRSDVEDVLSHS